MNQNRNNIGILLIYSLVVFFIGNQLLPITTRWNPIMWRRRKR